LALDRLFRTARTRNAWTDRPITEPQLRELYDLVKFGPTSANCCPARFVWVRSAEGKSKLAALAAPGNAPKILAAPVTVIVGYDLDFAKQNAKVGSRAWQGDAGVFFRSFGGANDRLSQQ
jgi:nitroreductase